MSEIPQNQPLEVISSSQLEIQDIINTSPYLAELYKHEPKYAEMLALVRQKTGSILAGDAPRTVYYVGIGGGDQPLDPFTAFSLFDADTVIGVDLLSSPNERYRNVEAVVKSTHRRFPNRGFTLLDLDDHSAHFQLDGRDRSLHVVQADARSFQPEEDISIIYSKGTTDLLTHIPATVADSAHIIFLQEEELFNNRVTDHYRAQGFHSLELISVPDDQALMNQAHVTPGAMPIFLCK